MSNATKTAESVTVTIAPNSSLNLPVGSGLTREVYGAGATVTLSPEAIESMRDNTGALPAWFELRNDREAQTARWGHVVVVEGTLEDEANANLAAQLEAAAKEEARARDLERVRQLHQYGRLNRSEVN